VFIAISDYTGEAQAFASSVSDSIVLVDGARLADLMIEHGVAVSHRTLHIANVDTAYFDEG
jgi:restriction system protein